MQTKRQSLLEAIASTAIGFIIAMITQVTLAWAWEKPFTLAESFWWTVIFTVVSVIRSYCVRRVFNRLHR